MSRHQKRGLGSSSSGGDDDDVGDGSGELTWREKLISGRASYILPLSLLGKN